MRQRHVMCAALAALGVALTMSACDVGSKALAVANSGSISMSPAGGIICTGGGPMTLQMFISSSGVSLDSLTWTVSDTTKATVSRSGLVTARAGAEGAVMVFVTTAGGRTSSTTIFLDPDCGGTPPQNVCVITGLSASAVKYNLLVGEGTALTVSQTTNGIAGCAAPTVSVNNNVVTATLTTVTGVNPGSAVVTVRSGDNVFQQVLNFTVTAPAAPGITVTTNTSFNGSCPSPGQSITVTVTNVTNPNISIISSTPNVAAVSGSGSSWTWQGLATGTSTLTVSVAGYPDLTRTVNLSVTCVAATPTVSNIVFNPTAICYSILTGGAVPQGFIQITGTVGAVVTLTSGVPGVVAVSPSQITLTATSMNVPLTFTVTPPSANQNVTIIASAPGISNAMNVNVRVTTSCGASSISYAPCPPNAVLPGPGGTLQLTAFPIPGLNETVAARPFWTVSGNASALVLVRGNEPTPITIGGIPYYWGNTATVTRTSQAIPAGTIITITVQWYPDYGAVPNFTCIWTP